MLGGLSAIALSLLSLSAHALPRHRETLEEAAVNAKKLVHSVSTGTMASVFPDDGQNAGRPFAMMEYHAPCHSNGSLTFVLMPISLSTRNILHNSNHYATYTVQMPAEGVRSPMSQGRVAFIGNMTILSDLKKQEEKDLKECYTATHPDAQWWTPDVKNGPHFSEWARFDIQDIYYVGGFGDTHYIGHIPVDLYEQARLPKERQGLVIQD